MPIIVERNKTTVINYDGNIKPSPYPKNDLSSVYSNWDDKLGKNVPTKNNHYTKFKEDK